MTIYVFQPTVQAKVPDNQFSWQLAGRSQSRNNRHNLDQSSSTECNDDCLSQRSNRTVRAAHSVSDGQQCKM